MEKSPLEKLRENQRLNTEQFKNPVPEKSPKSRSFWPILGVIVLFFVTKLKYLGFLPKLIPTAMTMGVSLMIYAQFYGWKFALGFLVLILIHEFGHGIAAKMIGLKVGVPIFVPFIGAYVALKEQPKSTYVEAIVGFGGPFAGLLGAFVVFCFGYYNENASIRDFCIALAWLTALINFFNMMPFFGMDGDHISQPLQTYHWVILIASVSGLMYWYHQQTSDLHPIMLILLFGAVIKAYNVWSNSAKKQSTSIIEKLKRQNEYPDEEYISQGQRIKSLIGYLFLAGSLTALMIITEFLRPKELSIN